MFRSSIPRTLTIALIAVLAVLAGGSANVVAQEGDTATHPIVGTWQVFLGDDPHVHGFLTHHADGTMTSSDPVTTPFAPGVFVSAAYGMWESTGPNTIAYTYQGFNSDAEGNVTGIVTVSGVRDVSADGKSFGGNGMYQVTDTEGNVLLAEPADDVRGQRLVVVPMESLAIPEATPAS